ncbi:hypothetical protein V8F20_009805 [Naviculisporaceae sp. PSN 640]
MEALAAVGLASAILTFIDAAVKVVTGTYEVYQSSSGATTENVHIKTIVEDLQDFTSALSLTNVGRTRHEIALKDLASKCETVSSNLQRLLDSLGRSGQHTTWASLKVKIKSMRKEKEIAGMEKQLVDYRGQILARLTLMLSQEQSSVKSKLDELETKAATNFNQSSARLAQHRQEILASINSINLLLEDSRQSLDACANKVDEAMSEVHRSLEALRLKMEAIPRENIILRNIFFSSMNAREESIRDPEYGTLGWILEDKERDIAKSEKRTLLGRKLRQEELDRRAHSRAIFLTWLRSGSGLFHISGKAGSGKSTLMKYLTDHHRTQEELDKWAASEGKTLVFARFYFWSSGDHMQKSLTGLYRSLLFETLKRCPELIPQVFPHHWTQLEDMSLYIPGDLFTATDFKKAFDTLTDHGVFPNHRFCFFIDGLDEYDGASEDYQLLAKNLQRWSSGRDVKICASSRPYLEFDQLAPTADRKFHLHELTRHDIYLFSRQMIEKDDNFDQVKDSYLRLVDEIVYRAEGVFLWARLVVSSLLAGMLRHDTTDVLERKIDTMPSDIKDLYDKLLGTLEPDDQERAARMLITAANCSTYPAKCLPVHCRVFGWVDKFEDPEFPPCDGREPPLWQAENAMTESIKRQLRGLTKGLLEVQNMELAAETRIQIPAVQFSHRTVYDFVMNSSRIQELSRKHPGLLEREWHLRLLVADLTLGTAEDRKWYWKPSILVAEMEKMLFGRQLPLTLLKGLDHVIVGSGRYEAPFGRSKGCAAQLSFVHFAAYAGQMEYVLREVQDHPGLLKGDKTKSILLSAVLGGQRDLTAALLEKGASPTDEILARHRTDEKPLLVPVWLAVSLCYMGSYVEGLHYGKIPTTESLGLVLDAAGTEVRNFVVLIGTWKDGVEKITQYITLEHCIQDSELHNKDRLLSLIRGDSSRSLFASVRRLAWQTLGVVKQDQTAVPVDTSACTPFRRGDKFRWDPDRVYRLVWGEDTVANPYFQIF